LVGDNEAVKTGQVLARIDDRDYRVALDQAKADVAAARAAIASKQAAIDAQQSVIESAKATIQVDQANQTFAEQENKRYGDLATTGYGSVQNAQQAASRIAASRASLQRDGAALGSAVKQVALLQAELAQAQAVLARDEASQAQAELNLSYTAIVSPVDGVVGNRTLRVGQYVQAGTQLMSVVPTSDAYVVANFKETQLTDVHRGQPVDIEVDMFPNRVYHGRVDSLAPASGQTFALLPPDNATGNFTKVVQRIPVKILLDPGSLASGDLRPGMSVTPVVDTKPAAATVQVGSARRD
jgi:membrane fusion protein (multidrug efflux system)